MARPAVNTIRYFIYIFNLLLLICGILMAILGAVMMATFGDFNTYDHIQKYVIIAILILVSGCILIIFCLLGCYGAKKNNTCFLILFCIVLFVIFVSHLSLVIWIFVNYHKFLKTIPDIVQLAWDDNDSDHYYSMDSLQANFDCCGIKSYKDYLANEMDIPKSCCGRLNTSSCDRIVYESRPGCEEELSEFLQLNMNIMGYAGLAVALVELIAFCLSTKLLRNIQQSGNSTAKFEMNKCSTN